MQRKQAGSTGIQALLSSSQVRRFERDGQTWYAAADVVTYLNDGDAFGEVWPELRQREPTLGRVVDTFRPSANAMGADEAKAEAEAEAVDVVDLAGVMRVVQAARTPRAERLKAWVAATAAEWVNEDENPELAALRARRLYEARGFRRRWVDKRLRGASARGEATAEWYKRGATESDQYRALTNAIVEGAFGMDVTSFRRHKGLTRTGQSLRDHMTDLELALTELGETVCVSLHRERRSQGFEQLERDARDAGRIVARTRAEIEQRFDHPVVSGGPAVTGGSGVETPAMARTPGTDAAGGTATDPDRAGAATSERVPSRLSA